jgi:hypothetical protein
MSSEQNRIQLANLQADHFPIHVYQHLAQQPVGVFSIWFTATCFLVPFFMLWHLRRGSQFQYAKLNRDMLVRQIATDYAMTLEQSARIQRNKFGLHDTVQHTGPWADAPFNTCKKQLSDSYVFTDQASFNEYLQTL